MFHSKHLCTCFMAAVFLTGLWTMNLSPLTTVLPLLTEVTDAAASHSLRHLQELFSHLTLSAGLGLNQAEHMVRARKRERKEM